MTITNKQLHDKYPALPKSLPRDTIPGATPSSYEVPPVEVDK